MKVETERFVTRDGNVMTLDNFLSEWQINCWGPEFGENRWTSGALESERAARSIFATMRELLE